MAENGYENIKKINRLLSDGDVGALLENLKKSEGEIRRVKNALEAKNNAFLSEKKEKERRLKEEAAAEAAAEEKPVSPAAEEKAPAAEVVPEKPAEKTEQPKAEKPSAPKDGNGGNGGKERSRPRARAESSREGREKGGKTRRKADGRA